MTLDAEVLIVGGGPAGLTAALTLARLSHTVKIFDDNDYRNKAFATMTMLIAHDGSSPSKFRDEARENLLSRHPNVSIEETTITKACKTENGGFSVEDLSGKKWIGKKLVLSTGCEDIFPNIKGYEDFWGKGIYHCYFYKGYTKEKAASSGILAVDVMQDVPKSMHAARYATQISNQVTIYTNGDTDLAKSFRSAFGNSNLFRADDRKISRFLAVDSTNPSAPHANTTVGIEFEDGTIVVEPFIGHYPLSKNRGPFAKQLGLPLLPSGDIATNLPWLQTDVRGVFCCGDNSQPRKIIPEAQNSGSLVGAAISNQIIAENFEQQGLV
ncbi:FAD/NAD(P)-binding domain-containing protein [Byssothecium circinans]|uniref:FAD/NAD(P)-binding domain-containing protein n=1 Tax=Byssothecium circinans TaxID=147558 RepID=A0A6A5THA9_9PLEO|nr:FAD/NAD(P)-binding domain-containing protein [Byssothecium circinans]